MPYYQFTIPAGGSSSRNKQAIAAALTTTHNEITGAPGGYVNCAFTEVPPNSIFVSGVPVEFGRMIGLIRRGRSEELKRSLLRGLAEAWSNASGEPVDRLAIFLHEIPGYQAMEAGELLPEAWEDAGAILS